MSDLAERIDNLVAREYKNEPITRAEKLLVLVENNLAEILAGLAAIEEVYALRQDLAVIRDQLVVTGGVSFADQSRIERCHTIAKQALQSKDAKP